MYMNINKEEFLQFALNENETTTDNEKIFKTMQDGITYIAGGDFSKAILSTTYHDEVTVFGFVYNGKFYSTHYSTDDIDLNFRKELNAFEDKFDADYAEAVKGFSLDVPAPVTDKTKECSRRDSDFEYYCKYTAIDNAKRKLFGIVCKSDKIYHNRDFLPIFFDCLKHPENYSGYIQAAIEENAHDINYRIKCEAEDKKATEVLKADTAIMYRLNMYKTLEGISGKTVKMTCALYGETFELSIQRENLMRNLWNDGDVSLWNFTSTVKENIEQAAIKAGIRKYDAKVLFTDIRKITYGKKVIFEQEG